MAKVITKEDLDAAKMKAGEKAAKDERKRCLNLIKASAVGVSGEDASKDFKKGAKASAAAAVAAINEEPDAE